MYITFKFKERDIMRNDTTKKPRGYWTKEKIQILASKYETKSEFRKNNGSAYTKAHREGWVNDVCSHMTSSQKPTGYWTYDRCKKEALKYETKSEFQKVNGSAYSSSLKNGWVDIVCSHMEDTIKSKGYWTYDRCKEEASKHEHKSDFKKACSYGYTKSRINGWLEDICSHMTPKGSLKDRFVYMYKFHETNSIYIGLTWNMNNRDNEHNNKEGSAVLKHLIEHNMTNVNYELVVDGYYPFKLAQELEDDYVKKFKEEGWNVLNVATAGSLGGSMIRWTKEKCLDEALKYESITEFQKGSSGACASVRRNNWLDEATSHMVRKSKPKGYWTKERCIEEVLKFKTKKEFRKKESGAYTIAHREGWIDDLFPKNK